MASVEDHKYQPVTPTRTSSSMDSSHAESAVTIPLMKDEGLEDYFRTEQRSLSWKANAFWANIVLGVVFTCSVLLVLCWSLHTLLGHDRHSSASKTPPPRLDKAYQPETDFDIVVSIYKEDPAAVNDTISRILSLPSVPPNHRVLLYSKDEGADVAALQAQFPNAEVIQLPNIGREGQTYLHHILNRWDDLARHTLFTQAVLDNFGEALHRIENYYVPETGMLGLSFASEVCDCHQCADPYWHDSSGVLAKTYEMANNRTCGWFMLSYKGQFISSAARVRGAGKEVYQYLYEGMTEPDSWAHQSEYLGAIQQPDSLNAPALGFSLERMWSGIMQCADLGVAARCPTMLSGWRRIGGKGEDCQCFDREPGEDFIGFM
ncbi:hypothetical protein M409DRAFT_51571 [Zasmidium cellare ATCC 36951]|uniref:Uncharacterized protein n=1 Tax=Zasmidium cellare ATCC 36951 TaxID=1080233 RepID=A0A6A6CTG1_ZASCE|nr:uncharacterized protein M409DRAFT_51571 [Zasmidium cellare ATCC 36951]KAF2170547.1 hypothetical protein M409DRAFT_51571 [Zasmidium cellare ATCC 36951]